MPGNYQSINFNQSQTYVEAYLLSEDGTDVDIWPPYKGIEVLSSGTLKYKNYYDKDLSLPVSTGRIYPIFIRTVKGDTNIDEDQIIVYR